MLFWQSNFGESIPTLTPFWLGPLRPNISRLPRYGSQMWVLTQVMRRGVYGGLVLCWKWGPGGALAMAKMLKSGLTLGFAVMEHERLYPPKEFLRTMQLLMHLLTMKLIPGAWMFLITSFSLLMSKELCRFLFATTVDVMNGSGLLVLMACSGFVMPISLLSKPIITCRVRVNLIIYRHTFGSSIFRLRRKSFFGEHCGIFFLKVRISNAKVFQTWSLVNDAVV